jgi:chaperonin GroEL
MSWGSSSKRGLGIIHRTYSLIFCAATGTEMKEKKARVEDALNATKAAVEEGIVPGGGVPLIRIIPKLDDVEVDKDQKVGVNIVKRALEETIRQIVANAGWDGSIVVEKVREGKEAFGFDAAREEYCDMVKGGIIDPTKVIRCALQNAASVGSLLLTTEALVAQIPEEKKTPPMPPGGYGGGY